jgi:hypothetical protein
MVRLLAAYLKKRLTLLVVLGTAGLLLSCSLLSGKTTPVLNGNPTGQSADTQAPTNKQEPLDEPTADLDATRQAEEEETAAAEQDLADAVTGEIQSSLDSVGEMMGSGTVIFYNAAPIPVDSSKPNMLNHQLLDSSVRAADFAFHSNIKWEVKQKVGIVYCTMMFRISGDLDMDPWYMMQMGRISGLGHIFFDVVQQWSIIGQSNGDASNYIKTGNGDTNDVLLVARANQFTAYVNGKQVSVWWNTKIDQGGFGIGTMQDTGASTCTFGDTWIWSFE